VICTASHATYAKAVIDLIDPG